MTNGSLVQEIEYHLDTIEGGAFVGESPHRAQAVLDEAVRLCTILEAHGVNVDEFEGRIQDIGGFV